VGHRLNSRSVRNHNFFPAKKAFFFQGSEKCLTIWGRKRGWRTCEPSGGGGGWGGYQVDQAETVVITARLTAIVQPLPATASADPAVTPAVNTSSKSPESGGWTKIHILNPYVCIS